MKKISYENLETKMPLKFLAGESYEKQFLAEDLMRKHGEMCDCLLAHFLRETGFKAKDVRLIEQRLSNSLNNFTTTFIFIHKNTPRKYYLNA